MAQLPGALILGWPARRKATKWIPRPKCRQQPDLSPKRRRSEPNSSRGRPAQEREFFGRRQGGHFRVLMRWRPEAANSGRRKPPVLRGVFTI